MSLPHNFTFLHVQRARIYDYISLFLLFFHSFTLLILSFPSRIYFQRKFLQSIFFILRAIIFYLNVRSLYRGFIFINTPAFSMRVIRFLTSLSSICVFKKSVASFASYWKLAKEIGVRVADKRKTELKKLNFHDRW